MTSQQCYEGLRVYHRARDLFGWVKSVQGNQALVKYEWPWDPKAEPEMIETAELDFASAWE